MADGSAFLKPRSVIGFAGGGGSSVAFKLATGLDPDVAMNHWLTAILAHQRHFPETDHRWADIHEVDPDSCLPGEEIAFGWFSPDCTDFSKAKGKAPRSERIRGLAWSVIPWAVKRRIRVIMLENVEEFQQWGPVYRTGLKAGEPIPARRGETFARWRSRLEKLGYAVEWRVLNAADYGAPTTRKRLYLIARCDGLPIVWPERTHAPRKDAERLGLKPWRGACEIIDFTKECPSILMTAEEAEAYYRATGTRVRRPLVPATQRRVFRGCERYVMRAEKPYVVRRSRAAGGLVPITQKGWGGDRAHGVRDPLKTLTSSKGGEFALSEVELAALASVAHGEDARAWPVEEPARTQTGKHDKALIGACLVPRYGEREGQAPRCLDVEGPAPCAVPTGNGGSLVAASLHQMNTRDVGGDLVDPTRAQPAHDHQALQAAYLVRQFGSAVGGRDAEDPLNTVMSQGERGGGKDQLVTAFMAQGNGERLGRAADAPTTTLTERATQQQLVAANLDVYYGGANEQGADLAEPARTSTGKDRMSLVAYWLEQANTGMVGHPATDPVSTIIAGGGPQSGWAGATQRLVEARLEQDGGEIGRRARVLEFLWRHAGLPTLEEWADPTGTPEARVKFGLVILDGQVWMIVDIGLRMLTPAELAAAMGLPPEYDLSVDFAGKAISKTHQTQMIGNMVSPPPAAALIAANCPDLIQPGWGPGVTEPERRAA
jgi:DNA (cytosine-5)-methyltransferase 1